MNGITQPAALNLDCTWEPPGELVKNAVVSVTLRDSYVIDLRCSLNICIIRKLLVGF